MAKTREYVAFLEKDKTPRWVVARGDRIIIATFGDDAIQEDYARKIAALFNSGHIDPTDVARIIIALQRALSSANELLEKVANDA